MKKFYALIFICLLLLQPSGGFVYGSSVNVSSDIKLDLEKQITGQKAKYTLDVPANWKRYVSVFREDITGTVDYIEKLTFYYAPVSVNLANEILLEIFIYEKDKWDDSNADFIKLAESNKYVMAQKPAKSNPFVFGSDRLIFDNLMKDAAKPAFFKDYISFPQDSDDFVKNIVTVNGRRISDKAYVTSLRVVYVPVRETCEGLGYSIGWNESDSTVSVSSGSFFTELGYTINKNKRYNLVNINGQSYVSTMFFIKVLNCNVEVDEYNNVRITK